MKAEENLIWEAYTTEASYSDIGNLVDNTINNILDKATNVGLDVSDENVQHRLVKLVRDNIPAKDIDTLDILQRIKDKSLSKENLRNNVHGGAVLTVGKVPKKLFETNEYELDQQQDGTIRIFVKQVKEKNIGTINPNGTVVDGTVNISKDGKSVTMHIQDNDKGLIGKTFQIPSGQLQSVFRVTNTP